MGIYTQALIKNRLSGKIASMMLILLLFVGVSHKIDAANINMTANVCANPGGSVLTNDILSVSTDVNGISIPAADLTPTSAWNGLPAPLVSNGDDQITGSISGYVSGSTYTMVWDATGGSGDRYFIDVKFVDCSVTQAVEVCQEGVIRLASFLTDPTYMGGNAAPPGHLKKGYWSNTAGLTLSNINDPNAIISDFALVAGTTYVLTWYHGVGQTYDITLIVTNNVSPEYELLNEDGTTDNVLYCTKPNNYTFNVEPTALNPGAIVSTVDYVIYHDNGTSDSFDDVGDPKSFSLNNSINYADLDVFQALVSDGTCLDITTNTIQLGQLASVIIQIQGGKSACDPNVFDGTHVLEVLPYDPINFDYQWRINGVNIPGETNSTHTLLPANGAGNYSVVVTDKANNCGPFFSSPVIISNIPLPSININDSPLGSGRFEICNGTISANLTTTVSGGFPVGVIPNYVWYQNSQFVTGSANNYNLDADVNSLGYNAYGDYVVEVNDANNPECRSVSTPVSVIVTDISSLSFVAINGPSFCDNATAADRTPQVRIDVVGGSSPYTVVISANGTNLPARSITSGVPFNLSAISANTSYSVTSISDINGCVYTGGIVAGPSYTVLPAPTVQSVTGSDLCKAPADVTTTTIGLSNSESGVTYVLVHDDGSTVTEGENIISGGGAFNFAPVGAYGTYTVLARFGDCADVVMNGNVYIGTLPVAHNMTRITGAGCSNVTHVFGLDASEDGVTYTLFFNGLPHPTVAPVNGNVAGTAISFTGVTAPGSYRVMANKNGCEQYMTGTFNIVQAPIVTGINIVGTDGCSNELKNIGISINEAGVTYDLIRDGNVAVPVASILGDGTAGIKYFYGANTTFLEGIYTVRVTALNGCEDWLAGSITIHKEPDDLAFTTTGQVCGTGNVIIPVGEAGVRYTLYEGSPAVSTGLFFTGNGTNQIAFNNLGPGYYTVYAEVGTCSKFLSDFLEVETQPLMQIVNVPDDNYCSNETGIDIIVNASQINFDYELYNLGTSTVDQTITATNITGVTFSNVTAGNYEVRVVNSSCTLMLRTNILIVEYAVTNPNANIPTSFCSDQGVQTISGSPAVVSGSSTGLYTIIGGAGFDPGHTTDPNAGSITFDPANCAFSNVYTIRYEYTDGNGCIAEDIQTTIVYDLANGAITISSTVPANPCQTDNTDYALQGLLNGSPIDGTFSSAAAGLKNIDPVTGTADFNPFEAGNGVHTIDFDYVDPASGCTGNASITITIGTPLNMVGFTTNYCSADNTYKTLDANPGGGTFAIINPAGTTIESGIPNGNNDKLNPKTYFDAYGDGTYQLVYTYNNAGCINTLTTDFEIVESIDANFTFPFSGGVEQTTFCVNDANATLTPIGNVTPANVTSFFSGNGIAGNMFLPGDPNVDYSPTANPITHQVTNTVGGFTCTTTATRNAFVAQVDIAFSGLNTIYCENDGVSVIGLNGADAALGTATFSSTNNSNPSLFISDNGDNTADLDPSVGPGVYEVKVEFEKAGDLCERTLIQTVTVEAITPVNFSGFNDGDNVCSSSAILNLSASPAVGTGAGNYILLGGGPGLDNGTADNGLATLDPSLMSPGTFTVRYNYINAAGCATFIEKDIIISDAPATTHMVTGGGAYCDDTPPATKGVTIGLGSATVGVQYELLLNNSSTSPAATYTPTSSGAFNFTVDNTTIGADRLFTATGTYTVRAVLVGCSAIMTGDVSVEQYELTLTTSNVTPVSCKDGNDGSLTLVGGGGSGSYQYRMEVPVVGAWTATPTFNGLEDGSYEFSIRDLSTAACEKLNLLTVNITEPADALTLTEDASKRINVGCVPCTSPGTCEGSATLVITGGTPFTDLVTYPSGYDITWPASANNQKTITATQLDVGTYGVQVEDANGCIELINITISADVSLSVVEYDPATEHDDNVCFGGTDGAFMVQASGGSGQYLFSIDGTNYYPSNHATDPSLHTFSNLAAASYTVYVQDLVNNRCNYTIGTNIVITEPAAGLSLTEIANNPVSCYGGSDGSFTVQAAGGNGFYEFSNVNPAIAVPADWIDNGTNEFTVNALPFGNHSVWVRDRDNPTCPRNTLVVNVNQALQLSVTAPVVQNVTCHSGLDGQIELLGAGGSGNYVYSIDGGTNWQASNIFASLPSGSYQFSIAESSDPLVCNRLNILSITLTQPADFTITEVVASHKDVSCNGGMDGEFEVVASGGVGLKEYRLNDGTNYITVWDTNPVFSNLVVGTYEVSVRDRVSLAPLQWCEKDRILSVTISEPAAALSISAEAVTDAQCFGDATGSVNITVAGGTAPYTYQWTHVATNTPVSLANGGQSTNPINLLAGEYRVDIMDANTICTLSKVYTVGEESRVNLVLGGTTNPDCYAAANGSITVNASGGAGTYEYQVNGSGWVGGPTGTHTFSALGAGTYTIQVRDAAVATCVSPDVVNVNLTQPNELDLFVSAKTDISCNGAGDGSITIGGIGRALVTDYDYYCQEFGAWQASPIFPISVAGNYHFKVRDRLNPTCESALSAAVNILEPGDFTTTVTVGHVSCATGFDGQLIFNTLPATGTYEYSLDGGTVWQSSPISGLTAGTYSVLVKDLSTTCEKAIPDQVITEPLTALSIDNNIITEPDCNGDLSGAVEVVVSGGTGPYTYQWRNMSTGVDVPPANNGDQAKAINLPAGDYQVTITDAELCTLVSPAYTIIEPAILNATYNVDHISVVGLTDGRIVVDNPATGGTAPYTITWADGAAFDGLWTRDNLSAGTYTFTVEDSNGCTFVQAVNVLANLALDVSVVPNTINCYAAQTGIIAVNINGGTGPYNIAWSGTLYDGSTDSDTDTNIAPNYEIKPLYAGTYSVTVTDANSVSQTITNVIITQPDELVITNLIEQDISCFGANDGRIQVAVSHGANATGAYSMSWTGPGGYAVAGTVASESDQTGLTMAGDYEVIVNYNGTCSVSETYTIDEPTEIVVLYNESHISAAGANDGQIVVTNPPTGGVPPYTISWADGAGAFDGQWTRTLLAPGNYDFTVTDDAGSGCSVTHTATILDIDALDYSYTVTDVNCYSENTGIIALVLTGGTAQFDLEWNAILYDGTTDSDNVNNITTNYEIKDLKAGDYTVKITDANNAEISYTITVGQPDELVINTVIQDDISCAGANDGHIQVSVSQGITDVSAYTMTWTGPGGFSASGPVATASDQANLVLPGDYTVTVNYNSTCNVSSLITIDEPTPIVVNELEIKHISVAGATDGRIVIENPPTGGESPYAITWADGAAYDDLWTRDNLAAGNYTYTVTDNLNCTVSNTIIIEDLDALDFTLSANTINCYGAKTGIIALTISGGVSPFDIEYDGTLYDGSTDSGSDTGITTNYEIKPLFAGDYTIKIIDDTGAELTKTITVAQAVEVVITPGVNSPITCFGDGDGSLQVNVTQGVTDVSAYPIYWSGPGGYSLNGTVGANSTISNLLLEGTYTATVTYNGTCTVSENLVLDEPDELSVSLVAAQTNDVSCNGGIDGQIGVSVSGGFGFSYQWAKWNGAAFADIAGETNPIITGRDAGRYRVTATLLSTGCPAELEYEITEPSALSLVVTPIDISTCNGDDSGQLSLVIDGGVPPYRYNYGTGDIPVPLGQTNVLIEDLFAGLYDILITDYNNCTISSVNNEIKEPTTLDVIIVSESISCEAGGALWPDGELVIDIQGGRVIAGTQSYLMSLQPASGAAIVRTVSNVPAAIHTETFGGLLPDTYTLNIYDQNSQSVDKCIFTYGFTLELIDINGTPENATCEGVADGKITGVTIDGTSGTYTFTWTTTDGGTGFDPSTLDQDGLSVGTYRLTVTDTNRGCSVDKDFVIGYDNEIIVDGTVYDVECYGDASGAITLNMSGVSGSETYLWTGPGITPANQNDKDLTALVAGDYTVQVTDGINSQTCGAIKSFTVRQSTEALDFKLRYLIKGCTPYVRTIEIYDLVGGTGNTDPASGDFKYNVSGPGPVVQDPADYKRFDITVGGTYTVTVTDKNDCNISYDISIPIEMGVSPVITDVKCNGGNTGAIAINLVGGSGSFTYDWTKTGDATFTANTPNISALTAGEYVLVVTDNIESDGTACARTYTLTVNEPQPIVISVDDKGDVTCNGDADGYVNLDIQGGVAPYTYNWNPAGGGIIQGQRNQTGLIGGTYTVIITDDNLCTASTNVIIDEPDVVSGSIVITDTECDGTNGALTLTPTGGSGAYTYSWSTSDGDATAIIPGAKDQTGLTGGTYTVVITDADPARSGCQYTLSTTLTKAIDIENVVLDDVSCAGNNDGSISFDVLGGDSNYTYSWTTTDGNPAYLSPGVRDQSGLTAGTYTVVISDGRTAGGVDCEISRSFTIEESTGLVVNVNITHVKCNGASTGAIKALVTGGSGNYAFDWNGGAFTTDDISNVPAGNYTLVVTDTDLLCTYTNTYTITQPVAPININVNSVTDILCRNEATGEIDVTISGGTAPYTYFWTGPSAASGANPTGLLAGTYNLAITDDNGCVENSGAIIIIEPATSVEVSNPVVVDAITPGGTEGSITVTVNGGSSPYTFEWYEQGDLSTVVSTANPATGLGSGTYDVVATDQNGCSYRLSGIKVTEPGEALGFVKTVHHVSPCNGLDNGELIIEPFGGFKIDGIDYRIQITGPGTNEDERNTIMALSGLAPGTYRVTVSDASSPDVTEDIVITEYSPLNISTTKVTDVTCYGTSTGEISVTVNGGRNDASGFYLVEIRSAEGYFDSKADVLENTAFSFTNLPFGNYTITVFDHAGSFDSKSPDRGNCEASDVKLITEPQAEVAISSQDGSSDICNGESFDLALTTTNWDFVADGNLLVTVYDGFTYDDIVVTQSPELITVSPSSSRTYEITKVADPITSSCLKGFGNGSVQLLVNELATATITGPSEVCEDGEVQLSVALTGKAPWTIIWVDDNNGTTNTIPGIASSPYTFTDSPAADASYRIANVTDGNTCNNAGVGVVNVVINPKPSVTLTGSQDICVGSSATLVIDLSTGVTPYTITYEENGIEKSMGVTPSSGTTYDWLVTPIITSTYVITNVVDAKGCVMDITGTISATVTVNQLPGDMGTISTAETEGVCQTATGVIYSVDPVSDAGGGYIWTAPLNSTIVSGNGSTSVVMNFDVNFTGGYLRVYATNSCGDGTESEIWIAAKLLPDAAGVISGPTEFCQGTSGIVFSLAPVANASKYRWSLPTGFNIVGADTTASITVDLDPMLDVITGDITVTPYNDCGDGLVSPPLTVNVYPLPTADAGVDENICSNTYTLNATDPASIDPNWSGKWEVISGYAVISNVNAFNSNVSNMSRGDVTFRWTVTNNSTGALSDCSVYDEVTIRNNTLSVDANAANNNVCNGTTTLVGTEISTTNTGGLWEAVFPVGSTAVFSSTTTANTTVSNMMPDRNVFRWTLTQNGCDSFGEVEIFNNEPSDPIIQNGSSVAVCDTEITLIATAPSEGNGTWTLISGAGVIATPTSATTLVTGLDYGNNTFRFTIDKNGCGKYAEIVVRNNTLQVDAGADETVCNGELQLNATVPPTGVSGRWIVAEGAGSFNDGFSPTAIVTGLAQGTNRLVWELTQDGCVSSDEIIITNNQPTEATVGSNRVICADEVQLSGNAPSVGQGYWSIVSGSGQFEDDTDPITMVRQLGSGINIFRWTIMNNGCSSSADISIENLHVYVNAGKDSIVCGRTTRLNANIPELGIGEWGVLPGVGGGTISDQNDPNTQVGGLMNGPNGFIWKVSYRGCESRDTVIINNNTPYPVNAGTDQIIAGGATTLNATPTVAGVGQWTLVAGGATITDDLDPFTMVSDLRRGDNVLRWTVTNLGCTEFDDVTITNGETIDADAGLDQVVCDNFAFLQANDPDVGIGEWSVVSGAGQFESINSQKTRVNNLGNGDNVFRWTIYYTNSSSTDEVTITNNKVTTANAGPDRELCGDEYQLEANIPAIGNAAWTLISGSGTFDNPNDPNTFVRGLSQGENVLKYEIAQLGCSSVDSVIINNMLPTPAYAGEDEVICTDSIELRPNTPTFGVGEWRVKEGSADFDGNWAKNLAPGRNVLSWVITSGRCTSSDDVIIINNQPSTAFAGQDRIICVDNVSLSANIPQYGIGLWELISGSGDITDPTDPYTTVTNIGSGKNRFRWTIDNNGCTSSDDVEIANNFIQSFAGFNQINCADTALLEANNAFPGEGTWGVVGGSGSAYFDEPHSPYSKVRNLDHGDNVLTWTVSYEGCNSTSQITITNNNPTPSKAGPDQALCVNNTVLAANVPTIGDGEWTIRNGSGGFSSISDPTASVSNLAFGDNVFRWTVTHQGCVSIDDVQVSFNRIDAVVGPDQSVCEDFTQLEANNASPGIGTWSIIGGSSQAVFDDQNNPNTVVRNLAKGDNQLMWTILYKGCETSQNVTITNNSPSAAYAGNSQTICDDVTNLNATAVLIGVGRWEVLTGSGTITDINDPKSEVRGLSKGDNVFRWIVQNQSCTLTDEVRIVNNKPSIPYAGKDEELCSPQMTLKASPPEYGSGLWTIVSGGGNFDDPTSPSATVSNLTPGTNVLRWTLTQGQCTLLDEITIENNTPTISNAGPDIEDCKDWVQLDANAPVYGTGSWSVVSGKGDFDSTTDPKTTIRNLGFGDNILMWSIQNGNCFSTDQVTIYNKVPDEAAAGSDRETCDDYIVLNANNPHDGAGNWSVISGAGTFDDPGVFNTTVRNLGYGDNVFKWTISVGECTTEDEVMVTSNKAAPFAGEDDVSYSPDYAMQAENPGNLTGTWTIVAGGGTFDDPNFFNTTVRGMPEGKSTYRWTIITDGCEAYDDVTIDYKVVPESGFTTDVDAGCYPLDVKFTNYTIGGTSFEWDFGDGSPINTQRNPSHTFEEAGVFTVILTAPGPDGRDAVSSQVITVHEHPVADFNVGPTVVWIPNDPIKCSDLSIDAVKWLWNFGDGSTSEEQHPTYTYSEAGLYSISLYVENQFGCDNTYVVNDAVEAKLSGFISFPDTFAPRPGGGGNSGGIGERNDAIFKPKHRDVDKFHMQIFNRWGQLIFETREIEEGWDGMFDGKLAPQAVYVFKASGSFVNGVEFREAGSVLLVR